MIQNDRDVWIKLPSGRMNHRFLIHLWRKMDANLLWSVDDSCVVAKLQRSDDSSGQREQQVACYLLVLLGVGWGGAGQVAEQKVGTEKEKEDKMKPQL